MDVRRIPIHNAAAVRRVDLHVGRPMHGAAVREVRGPDSSENGVEFRFTDPEAIVLDRVRGISLVEVNGQAFIHVDRGERPDARFRPGNAEERGEQLGRGYPVADRDQQVIKVDGQIPAPGLGVSSIRERPLQREASRERGCPLTCQDAQHTSSAAVLP